MLIKSGGRKFRCIDCDVPDPLKTLENAKPTFVEVPSLKSMPKRCEAFA